MVREKQVLILIDGLDEAAELRPKLERLIDDASRAHNVGLLISTREYAYESSRECCRLRLFHPVKIQPLDQQRADALIQKRLHKQGQASHIHDFRSQLEPMAKQNPEMQSSPFMSWGNPFCFNVLGVPFKGTFL